MPDHKHEQNKSNSDNNNNEAEEKLSKDVSDFLATSAVHGLLHLGEKDTPTLLKIFWAALVVFGFGSCVGFFITLHP